MIVSASRQAVAEFASSPKKASPLASRKSALPLFGLLLVVLLTYGFFLGNPFVFDDGLVIADNLFIRSMSHAKDLFTSSYFSGSGELSYRPWVTFTYMIDYALFGLAHWGYHAHNVLAHLAVMAAFLWLLEGLGILGWSAWVATFLIALHPVAVESVICPSNREELYCALFLLLSLGFLMRKRLLPWACALFGLALLSKETAVALPLLWAGALFAQWRASRVRATQGLSAAGALCATLSLYFVVRFMLLYNPLETVLHYRGGSLASSLFAHARGWPRMLHLFLDPANLNLDFAFSHGSAWEPAAIAASGALVLALLYGAWLVSRVAPCMALGLFWIVVTFLPVAGFIPIANVFAERFLYLPLLGFGIIVAALGDFFRKQVGVPTVVAAAMCIACLGWMTWDRAAVWRDPELLWADAVEKNPSSPRAHNNLGTVFFAKGMLESARREFQTVTELDPGMINGWANLADYYEAKGDFEKAEDCYRTALMINENEPLIHQAYADVLCKTKAYPEAEKEYCAALRLRPHYAEAWNNLGFLQFKMGRFAQAKESLEKALQEIPEYPDALCNLGSVIAQQGNIPEAVRLWKKTLKLSPNHQGALSNIRQVQ